MSPAPLHIEAPRGRALRVLCLGAHSDDIEIGCGGTVGVLLASVPRIAIQWVVFSGVGARGGEARKAAQRVLRKAKTRDVVVHEFRDGFFPQQATAIKEYFETLKQAEPPDVIFTHYRADRHQDHRVISDLTWNTFRSHLILEYEIPKYDGDLGRPNCYVPLTPAQCSAKIKLLMSSFGTQRSKRWFTPDTFRGLLRLRGIESGAPSGFAEAFFLHKFVIAPRSGKNSR